MRKTDSIVLTLNKIREKYSTLTEAYSERLTDINNLMEQLKNNKTGNNGDLLNDFQRKFYAYDELLVQFQNWLDDIDSLEISDGLEKKVSTLYEHTKKEQQLIEELKLLIKDFSKAGNTPLADDLLSQIDSKVKKLNESASKTKLQTHDLNSLVFNRKSLINSLSEYI